MKILTEEEYRSFYKANNRFFDNQYTNPTKELNEKQILTKYQRYVKKLDKQEEKRYNDRQNKIDEWERQKEEGFDPPSQYLQNIYDAEKIVRENDPFYNDLEKGYSWQCWNEEEKKFLYQKSKMFRDNEGKMLFDPAHIISRGQSKSLASDPDNIILLSRYVHSCLDTYIHPLTGKSLSKEEHTQLWIKIVGQERWDRLHEKI